MRVLHVEHPDGRGPGVFGEGAERLHWVAHSGAPPPRDEVDAIVLYGAETNVVDAPRLEWLRAEQAWLRERLDAGTPVLGVCFGAQLVADALGAAVTPAAPPEIGFAPVTLTAAGRADPVLGAMPERFLACQWHSWQFALPPGADALAESDACLQAFRAGSAWGVQFHPEVDAATLDGWVAGAPDEGAAFAGRGAHLEGWNALGRRLFTAFLRAARRPGPPSRRP